MTPVDSIKNGVLSSEPRKTPEEGQRTYWLKPCGNNNKMKTIVQKPLMIKIIGLCLRNSGNWNDSIIFF